MPAVRQYLAFLRAINVGGHQVKMAQLKALFETLGFSGVETFIASGNVIFNAPARQTEAQLRGRIEQHLHTSLGYPVPTFLRTPAQLAGIVANAPLHVPEHEPTHTVHVGFLHTVPSTAVMQLLQDHETDMDTFACEGRELYWWCRGKTTDSLVTWPKLERLIKLNVTMRNMKTVKRLVAKYPVAAGH